MNNGSANVNANIGTENLVKIAQMRYPVVCKRLNKMLSSPLGGISLILFVLVCVAEDSRIIQETNKTLKEFNEALW